jgi:hypothetical protein
MLDAVKQTTPEQGSQSDAIQWGQFVKGKRYLSWKRFP